MSKKERKKELFIKTSNKIKTPNIFVNGYERKDVNGEKSQRNKLEKSKNGRFFSQSAFFYYFHFVFLFPIHLWDPRVWGLQTKTSTYQ